MMITPESESQKMGLRAKNPNIITVEENYKWHKKHIRIGLESKAIFFTNPTFKIPFLNSKIVSWF